MVILGSHKVSEIEPDPEKVEHDSEIKWLLKQKGDCQACYDVELRQDRVWNLDGAADERNCGIELPLGNLVLITWHVRQSGLSVRLLAQAQKQSNDDEVDRAVLECAVVLKVTCAAENKDPQDKMSESGKCSANTEHLEELFLSPCCFKRLAIHHDHVIDCSEVNHQEEQVGLHENRGDERPNKWNSSTWCFLVEVDNVPGSEHKQLIESLQRHASNREDNDHVIYLLYHWGNVI